jgi:alkylated DNA nucleotide flippase Atl1
LTREANRKETKVASVRAENVAEVVWELKRIDKFGTYTEVATRAGFKPGVAGRTLQTVLANVQRDWPHLQWWRTIPDDGLVIEDSPLAKKLAESGVALEPGGKKGFLKIADFESKLFTWDHQAAAVATA